MDKKKDNSPLTDAMDQIASGEIETSFILGVNDAGERLFINNLESPIIALEFLEVMLAGYRAMILEDISRRKLN